MIKRDDIKMRGRRYPPVLKSGWAEPVSLASVLRELETPRYIQVLLHKAALYEILSVL